MKMTLPSRLESVEQAAAAAERFAKQCALPDEFLFAIDMAIRESVANAVKHGNKFDESKNVEVCFAVNESSFEATVGDQGAGFTVEDVPDPTAEPNLLNASGRGVLFMRTFMDEVEWRTVSGGGTTVYMKKNRQH